MMCNLLECGYNKDLDKLHELVNKGLGRGLADGEDFVDVGNFGDTGSILDQLKSVST